MDDAWHAKCSSAWPPASPSVPPPPEFPAPSPGSVNQMGMNSRNFSHSFAQEMNLGNSATVQEPMVFNTLNLDSCKSGRAELNNSFFSLLSGHSHHGSSDILQLPYPRSPLAKPQVCHSGIVHGVSCGVPTTSIPPLSENRGNDDMGNGQFSQFVASRPLTTFTCNKTPLLHNDFQTASHCHGPNSRKPAPHQAFQGNSARTEVSARRHGWPTASISLKANQQHILSQTSHKMPLEAKPSISSHSSNFRGRPRVFCMNKVGELFVSDMGLLGVLCFCHKMPMSVTKFCEHSGSPSGDPGEAVHLENGMTVAQWRMLCSGVMASDHDGGWDWSDGTLSEGGLVRSKFSNFPTSSQNPAPINSNKAFGGLGRLEEPPNQFVFANHTYNGLGGKTALEKSANRDADNAHQRNGLMRYDRFAKSFASSIQTPVSVLPKNDTVQVVKESPVCISFQGAHSTLNKGKQNARPQFVSNNANYMGEIGNLPISFPRSGTRKISSFNRDISKGNFPSEALVVDQDSTSNIELRLGHPSQNNHLSVSSFPKALHPLQFGAMCNLQNPQLHQPLTQRTDYPKEAKRPMSNSQRTPSEVASFNTRKFQHSVGSNSFKSSESEDPMCDATKNSLISFLSHLSTEGNKPSKSTDDIGNYNDYHMTRVLDIDSLYAKSNLSDFMRETTDGIERKSNTNRSDVHNNIAQGKELRVSDNDSYSMLKSNYLVHNKQIPDTKVLASDRCIHNSSVDDEHSKLIFNQPSGMLNTVSDARTSNQCVEVSFLGNRDHNAHAIHRSTGLVSNGTTRPGSLNSETPMTLSLTNSIYMSEQASASSNKKKPDRHNNLSNESLRPLSLRSLAELSKPEQSSSSLEASHQRRRLCCLSDVESHKNGCQNDLMTPEELREGPCCIIQQDASKIAVRSSHSFSNCCSDGDIQMLAVKHGNTGPYKCCNCTTSPQRISLRSKEHDIQFSTGHICRAHEQPCLRLGRISKNNYSDSVKFGMCNQREESPSSGKCCCTILPKYLTGCCCSGGDNVTSALNGHVCGKARIMHVNPACDNDHMLHDGKRIRHGQCECLRKHVVMKNDWQIAHWRDVPNKVIGHSGPTSNEKPAQMLPATSSLGDHTMTVAKDLHRTQQGSESMKEQQMSNVCSGFSTPAITEVSIEVNNAVSFVTDAENAKIIHDFVVDEGSRIEKCGSSDEALDTRESEEAIIFKDKVNPTKSGLHCLPSTSGDLMDEHRLKSSSNLKRLRNQITFGCTGEENISQKWQFERPGKAEKRKGSTKCSILDVSVQQLGVSSIYSESSGHVGRSLHHSSSKEIEPLPQPDNLMQKTCILSGRSLTVKRKRSTLSSAKAFSIKRLVNNHKEGEYSKSLSTNDDHSLKAQKVSVGKKAKEELTMIVKQKDTHVATGKPPKYISLSCIGNSPIYGMDTSCKKVRPVVSGNSGIISSGLSDQNKPAKIVPLSLILKKASRCSITVNEGKPRPAFISKTRLNANGGCCKALSSSKVQHENADTSDIIRYGVDPSILVSGNEHLTLNLCSRKILKSALLGDTSLVNRSKNDQDHLGELCEENTRSSKGNNCQSSLLDSDVFCCVCGSSNQEVVNRLLECNRCLIRVHQACYGVSKIPKGHWHCRPCKANSLNIVCVLCGYGGGAMTRAVKSRNIVRSLLNAWKVRIGSDLINSAPSSKNLENELLKPSSVSDAAECDSLVSVVESITSESFPRAVSKMDIQMTSSTQYSDCSANDFQACNSIAMGILDPSITQWVHMVCGLWTPGTRCPNVDTMSTFDVSGASPSRKNNVCTMCNRPGGSCIQCRVLNCSIHFHPWCAHQKGLLQSEIEGDDNDKVGFYGRCMLHATNNNFHINPVDAEVESPRNRDWTCARTEGFKGRKRDEGLKPEHQKPYNDEGGCIVSQEQINAWLHINGQKSCTRGIVKLPYSDMEYDIRKEYIRYKQSKGWKQLVVYKSGIHALGLYTSQFIIRGAMVVEYVGEIVGLRVADKRELEYQSGRRLQYKSACYFFRIDKEHIIDATCKGGIARFVNHSCLPNSVAKIISVRNEKKVVFFAERDIYPGEEITYDYHFNHEDEGKKIPCFCKSKNCRRYLN